MLYIPSGACQDGCSYYRTGNFISFGESRCTCQQIDMHVHDYPQVLAAIPPPIQRSATVQIAARDPHLVMLVP